jgi:mannose-6-phosphate isomerase-like protein (cupin superfamily)
LAPVSRHGFSFAEEAPMNKPVQGHQLQRISFQRPNPRCKRGISALASTDILAAVVQTVLPGGRQPLHAHGSYDGLYFVLKGRARFYGAGNKLFAEVGPHEGVLVPRGVAYAFEAAGEEVQMIAIDAIDKTMKDTFVAHEPHADAVNYELFAADGTPLKIDYAMDVVQG